MTLNNFDRKDFIQLLTYASRRNITFHDSGPGIIMRHDIDDDLPRAIRMAEVESEYNVKATYFMLNTAKYWDGNQWDAFRYIEKLGHEIAWHNNVITQWIKERDVKTIDELIKEVLKEFSHHGFNIKGSASHGDKLCYEYGFVNNQVFTSFPKVGLNGKANTLNYEQVEMEDYGLVYEAYAVAHDVYLSESGKRWRSEIKESDLENRENRIQILTHSQHWDL